jgi:hypothetical protein
MELLLGCGHRRDKLLGLPGGELKWSKQLVTVDIVGACKPDILCDLTQYTWFGNALTTIGKAVLKSDRTFRENFYDEIHAYEVMEHLGAQGDYRLFFAQFRTIFDLLKAGGHFFATVPSRYSPWLWGDPSHSRVIYQESLSFLSQKIIASNRKQNTPMSDFTEVWPENYNFEIVASTDNHMTHAFCLRAIK